MRSSTQAHLINPDDARPGLAMLLVLVAVGIGVVLAGVMLVSRTPSAQIGANAAQQAAANWAAFAAERYAEAVMETSADWVAACAGDGSLVSAEPLAGGTVTITLTAPDGSPLDEADRQLLMTVTATVGQMTVTRRRAVTRTIDTSPQDAIDPYLGEFAIYATEKLDVENSTLIGPSPVSPESATALPGKIGVGFTPFSDFKIDSNATLQNVALYLNDSASQQLKDEHKSPRFATGAALPFDVPVIAETEPPQFATQPVRSLLAVNFSAANSVTTLPPGRYDSIRVGNSAIVNLGGPATTPYYYRFNAFETRTSGVVTFQGDVRVLVSSTFFAQSSSAIEPVDASSRITFYTANDVTITNAGVGVLRAIARAASRDPAALTSHISPDRLRILALAGPGADADPNYRIHNSFLVCSIHAPTADTELTSNTTMIGRITSRNLKLASSSTFLYDPTLDPRVGYTALDGPLYTDEGEPNPELLAALAAAPRNAGLAPFLASIAGALEDAGTDPPGGPAVRKDERAQTSPIAADANDFED
ncbi:MAG: hypothetical protein SFZ24_00495 [Planctomycetota bacterium]|nr:hypothetical protein [Planctomycetota bacterium]